MPIDPHDIAADAIEALIEAHTDLGQTDPDSPAWRGARDNLSEARQTLRDALRRMTGRS